MIDQPRDVACVRKLTKERPLEWNKQKNKNFFSAKVLKKRHHNSKKMLSLWGSKRVGGGGGYGWVGGGQCGGVGGRSAVLSNVSCQFSLCLQSETASRKQGGCNRIKTVPRTGGEVGREGVRGKGGRRENGQREGQARQHQESGGNNCLCGRVLIVHRSLAQEVSAPPGNIARTLQGPVFSEGGGEVSTVFVGRVVEHGSLPV